MADIAAMVMDAAELEAKGVDAGYYTEAQFYDDLMAVTEGRADPQQSEVLVRESGATVKWMSAVGVPFELAGAR